MRLPDWQLRLATLCKERSSAPFKWGAHDCCLWAADCVVAVTGIDPAAKLRGTYSGAISAAHVLEEHGGVEAIATAALGEPVPVGFAAIGDIVCIEVDGRKSLALCNGMAVLATGLDRLECLSLDCAVCAWKV